MPKSISENLIPALVVFGLGFILVGYVEGTIYRSNINRKEDEKKPHPYKQLFMANIIWFLLFVVYLFYRGVL